MNKQPITVTINLAIILLNGLIWLVLGFILIFSLHPSLPDVPGLKLGISLISFMITITLAGLVYFLRRHNRTAYYLTLAFFACTSILVMFDQIGVADIAFLVISVIPIILLILDRKWYLQVSTEQE